MQSFAAEAVRPTVEALIGVAKEPYTMGWAEIDVSNVRDPHRYLTPGTLVK
ncbi:hypothetical protein [Cupriavidus numazuensis]|uniref:hypothetical protein n=1 Tax=Cupriavidus numazuensis TaxID=221992 RepID=UPI001BA46975|nr:hypothetical protein [Cupriavidus numazuensis]